MLRRNLFYTLLLSVSQLIFPLITFPYSTRMLGPQGIGLINFIDSITQYFVLFAALGIPAYGIREIARNRNDRKNTSKIFSEIFIIHFLSTLFFSLIYLLIGIVIPQIRVNYILVLIGVAMLLFSVLTVEWFYSGIEQFSYITRRSLIVRILSVILLFAVLKKNSAPSLYYVLIVIPVAVTGIVNLSNLSKHVKFQLRDINLSRHFKPLLIIFSSSLAVSVYVLLDNIILGFLKGDIAVGIYSTAAKIAKIPFALFVAVNNVIVPRVTLAIYEERWPEVHELINKSLTFLAVIGLPICVGTGVLASFLVQTFAGNGFENAVQVLQILSPVTLIIGFTFVFAAQLLTPMGKERQLMMISIIGMIFSLIVNFCLIPYYSYYGASTSSLLTEILVGYLCYRVSAKYIKMKIDYRLFFKCLIGASLFIPVSFGVRSLELKPFAMGILTCIACLVSYVIYLTVFVKNRYLDVIKKNIFARLGF